MANEWIELVTKTVTTDGWVEVFNKVALGLVAIVSMVVGPIMQWSIAKKQSNLQAAIAKRQVADSIATKRQAWIDGLRAEISEFLSQAAQCMNFASAFGEPVLEHPDGSKEAERLHTLWDKMTIARARTSELSIRIKLRLNQIESEHIELMHLLDQAGMTVNEMSSAAEFDFEKENARWENLRSQVIKTSARILKSEWERVKRGDV